MEKQATKEQELALLSQEYRELRKYQLVLLVLAVGALILYFVDGRWSLAALGIALVLNLTLVRRKGKRYARAFSHQVLQHSLERYLDGASHTEAPVLEAAELRAVHLIPANPEKGSLLLREGGVGSYHGRPVKLGDASFIHTYSFGGKQHDSVVGCWIRIQLAADTGLDCRFLGEKAVGRYSLVKMAQEAGMERHPAPEDLDEGWTGVWAGEHPLMPSKSFLDCLNTLGKKTDGNVAVCICHDILHVYLVRQILGMKVSAKVPPGEGILSADALPYLGPALALSDCLL